MSTALRRGDIRVLPGEAVTLPMPAVRVPQVGDTWRWDGSEYTVTGPHILDGMHVGWECGINALGRVDWFRDGSFMPAAHGFHLTFVRAASPPKPRLPVAGETLASAEIRVGDRFDQGGSEGGESFAVTELNSPRPGMTSFRWDDGQDGAWETSKLLTNFRRIARPVDNQGVTEGAAAPGGISVPPASAPPGNDRARQLAQPPPPSSHRFDPYCRMTFGYEQGHGPLACVECGRVEDAAYDAPVCAPRPGWREQMEREVATRTIAMHDVRFFAEHAPGGPSKPQRYDVRDLLAPVGIGPDVLVCGARGKHGPLAAWPRKRGGR